MKRPFPLYSPHSPTLWPCSHPYCVRIRGGSDACNFTIPHLCLFFFPPHWKKCGKREHSENSRHYYCSACMAPTVLCFHLCFLLYWQMVVIRQHEILWLGYFSLILFSPLVFMTWWSSWQHCGLKQRATLSSVVWIEMLFATWQWSPERVYVHLNASVDTLYGWNLYYYSISWSTPHSSVY